MIFERSSDSFALDRLTEILHLYRSRGVGRIQQRLVCTKYHKELYFILHKMLLDFTVSLKPLNGFVFALINPYAKLDMRSTIQNVLSIAPYYTSVKLKTVYICAKKLRCESRGEDDSIAAKVLEMSDIGIASERSEDETAVEYLERRLVEKNLKLIIVVENADYLFKVHQMHGPVYAFCRNSIGEIIYLHERTSSPILLIVTSEWLRFAKFLKPTIAIRDEYERYPLLEYYTDSNTKLVCLMQEFPRMDDLAHMLAMLFPHDQIENPSQPVYKEYSKHQIASARRYMYFFGLSKRSQIISGVTLPNNHMCVEIWLLLLCMWFGYRENRRILFQLSSRVHYKQNLLELLQYGKWARHPNAIENLEWEGTFKPVVRTTQLIVDEKLEYYIYLLVQEGYVIVTGDHIFPSCMWVFEKNLLHYRLVLRKIYGSYCNGCSTPEPDELLYLTKSGRNLVRDSAKYLKNLTTRNEQ